MLEDNTIVTVTNRNNGSTGYSIPEMNGLRRNFAPGESKKITMDELRKLSYQPGGDYLLKNYLIMFNEDAVSELIGDVEPEYYYTDADIQNLLVKGTVDQLDDCLTFAPKGVIEVVKNMAVQIKLNDMDKRELIFEKTGFSPDNAIKNNKYAEEADKKEAEAKKVRKAAVPGQESSNSASSVQTPTGPQRKTSAPKYKVVTEIK
jgi:hypothetical protein